MSIETYKKILKKPVLPRTVVFLLKNTSVLLGLKKTGHGKNNFLGIGGKLEAGESIEDAAVRELAEEIGISSPRLRKVGIVNFYFPHIKDERWNMQVHVFTTTHWMGTPQESEEIKPVWFDKNTIPYDRMWDDARYWLPQVLDGQKMLGEFMYNSCLVVTDFNVKFF